MDLRDYYKKIRDLEAQITEDEVVVISQKTPDGGVEGTRSQVSRFVAAKLIVEGRARMASAEESAAYFAEMDERRRAAREQALQQRVQVVLSDSEKNAKSGSKQ
jgi:hypothetical protein